MEDEFNRLEKQEKTDMAKERRGNREAKKPKKEKIKVIAARPVRDRRLATDPGFRHKK